jgi:hypothetical protein
MKKEVLYRPKALKKLSLLLEKKIVEKEKKKGILTPLKKVFK